MSKSASRIRLNAYVKPPDTTILPPKTDLCWRRSCCRAARDRRAPLPTPVAPPSSWRSRRRRWRGPAASWRRRRRSWRRRRRRPPRRRRTSTWSRAAPSGRRRAAAGWTPTCTLTGGCSSPPCCAAGRARRWRRGSWPSERGRPALAATRRTPVAPADNWAQREWRHGGTRYGERVTSWGDHGAASEWRHEGATVQRASDVTTSFTRN